MTTMTYVVRDGKPFQLDVYRRDRPLSAAPLVIAIHGGSWRSGNRSDLPALNDYLASRGYVVATPSYRFAPAFPHPASSRDIDAAISFLKANASQLGIDTTRIVLLGRSAGAQLALLAGYTRNDSGIKGVVSFYGPTDQKWDGTIQLTRECTTAPRRFERFCTVIRQVCLTRTGLRHR